mgnify:FL=1
MPEQDPDRGPMFVWNFPLIRRMQSRGGLLALGAQLFSNAGSSSNDQQDEDESTDYSTDDSSDNTQTQADVLSDIESSIDDLQTDSSIEFEQEDEGESVTVTITNEGFDPSDLEVDTGDTVVWVNESDTQSKIASTNNNKLRSDMLDPGDEYSETLYGNVTTEYRDSLSDNDSRGSITVGDPDAESPEPVPLTESTSDGTPTMSQAVDDKTDLDIGFDT